MARGRIKSFSQSHDEDQSNYSPEAAEAQQRCEHSSSISRPPYLLFPLWISCFPSDLETGSHSIPQIGLEFTV